ncbi:hypothetical protein CEXT_27651 [Caerostris extrusa]|uniref:Uncharacterized protein n=1 Tax=Caerostris extrusa TaxID=172846 RepID=A0AAV4UZF7_CAEEX|nr:hypothetical protein CEXT_27651 [Caerostris extrusa]
MSSGDIPQWKWQIKCAHDPRTSVLEDGTSSSGRCCPVMREERRRRNIEKLVVEDERPGRWHLVLRTLLPGDARRRMPPEYPKTSGGGFIENNKLDIKESDIDICEIDKFIRSRQI